MDSVFVDTAAWIAIVNSKDKFYSRAQDIMGQLEDSGAALFTTEFVLLEVADALCAPHLRQHTISFLEQLRTAENLQIFPLSDELLQAGWQLYAQRPDKEWGLTDCISFAAMTRENITIAFSSDHHFEQAGFAKLM